MHSSAALDASPHCRQSPDGRFIATLRASAVTIRSTVTLQITNVVSLGQPVPPSAPGSTNALNLLWGPSSTKFLVSTAERLELFSISEKVLVGSIDGYVSTTGKPSLIQFGASDSEVFVWSASGTKLVIFNLQNSHVTEIASPKFHLSTTALRGLSFRPGTGHLALLTRTGGKDHISIHHSADRRLLRSWTPDTVDAQNLTWSPDGKWLVLTDSAAHGHRLIIFAADGEHFRTLGSTHLSKVPEAHLETGIQLCQLSPNSELCAVGDHSRDIGLIHTLSWRASSRLVHPTSIVAQDLLHVWREQIELFEGRPRHIFVPMSSTLSPPGPVLENKASASDLKSGCSMVAFDASSAFLATRLDESPWTLWIWDLASAEPKLRAVLIFHASVNFQWHPSVPAWLLVTRQEPSQNSVAIIWCVSSNGPLPVVPVDHLPNKTTAGKTQVAWINRETEFPELLVSDPQHYLLLSPLRADEDQSPWQLEEKPELNE